MRGEQTEESDHDLIVILKRVQDDTWDRMRAVFEGRGAWSTYVKTQEELRQYPAPGRLQFHYGHVCLYGDFVPPPVTREGLLQDLRRHAVDIGHEARYRLIHEGPDKVVALDSSQIAARKRRNARLFCYQAKIAVLAMKARELYRGASYPESRKELRSRLSDTTELTLIDAVGRWPDVKAGYEEDFLPLARLLDEFTRSLVRELDSEAPR